jgi:soluble lytic murein transglycosylase-like protein
VHARLNGMDFAADFILAAIPRPHIEVKGEGQPAGAANVPVQQTGRAVPKAPPVAAAAIAPPAPSTGRGLPAARAGPARWESLVSRYRWPVAEALSVLSCESRGDPAAYRAGNYGLFQINSIHAWRVGGKVASLFDPETNVRVAYDIWRDNAGWGPWACKP